MSKEELQEAQLIAARHHNEGLALKERKADIDWWEKIYHSSLITIVTNCKPNVPGYSITATTMASELADESLKRRQEFLDSLTSTTSATSPK